MTQISIRLAERNAHGARSDQYLPLQQNRGVVDAYKTIPFTRYAHANSDESYVSEYYFTGDWAVSTIEWSPNQFVFHIKSENEDRLVTNQNFDQGWHSMTGNVTSHAWLLAIDLSPGDYEFAVFYLPNSFNIVVCVLFITLGILLLISLAQRLCQRKA